MVLSFPLGWCRSQTGSSWWSIRGSQRRSGITIPPALLVQAASVKVGDFPVEQPTQIELAVCLRTVKALSLQITESWLPYADKMIE